jgi:CheY-like chemotaxis protein
MPGFAKDSEPARTLRLLIVDDNQDAADSLVMLLRMWGHEARAAYDGATALKAACDFHPDCVLLDISMPGMDGYEVARALRSQPQLSGMCLVALSAFSSEDHRRRANEVGIDQCLVKPANAAGLNELLIILMGTARVGERLEARAPQCRLTTQQ